MQAIVYARYGSPEVLRLREVEKPVAEDGYVLVEVHAASVNPLDWHRMRGEPLVMRLSDGLSKPKNASLGADLAGRVEAVGGNVTQFQPGDEVYGMSIKTCAEYARVAIEGLAKKPANLSFVQAAAVPVAAITALQGLRDKAGLQPGQKVLINGAAGGVGTFAVQIAKAFGAEVTGVCTTNLELVRSLGADHVIDYEKEDFTRSGERYDVVFDAVCNRSLADCRRVLAPEGTLVLVGAGEGRWIRPVARALGAILRSRFARQKLVPFIAQRSADDLDLLRELIEAGKVTPVVDRQYPLQEVPEAIRYLEEGHAQGKVVIAVKDATH